MNNTSSRWRRRSGGLGIVRGCWDLRPKVKRKPDIRPRLFFQLFDYRVARVPVLRTIAKAHHVPGFGHRHHLDLFPESGDEEALEATFEPIAPALDFTIQLAARGIYLVDEKNEIGGVRDSARFQRLFGALLQRQPTAMVGLLAEHGRTLTCTARRGQRGSRTANGIATPTLVRAVVDTNVLVSGQSSKARRQQRW